ncbi:MAG: chemotaxis protein CheA [Burkholderiales bacterium]
MSEFLDMQDLLPDFLAEAGEMLEDVDQKLVELEHNARDKTLLNTIFRGFHTIKGGAGFLDAGAMVELCHRTENLFDHLRSDKLSLTPEMLDVILAATGEVKRMMDEMAGKVALQPAPPALLDALDACLKGELPAAVAKPAPASAKAASVAGPDWEAMHQAVSGAAANSTTAEAITPPLSAAHEPDAAVVALASATQRMTALTGESRAGKPGGDAKASVGKDGTLRVDTVRFDQILNLSGEIGLTKNRLNCLRSDLVRGDRDGGALKSLEQVLGQLDTLVSDLQSAVMKARMQPVGRVFQKYNRLARDVARTLGKDVDLIIEGADTEVDKTILEELNDPLVHLVRNSVDHGLETPDERVAAGKPARGTIRLSARQAGDHIVIEIIDDGRGMRADFIREKAVQKGLISGDQASTLDERQSLNLIFLPGFSTKTEISSVSGRGVGMDVVRTNIVRLKGRIELSSTPGSGSRVTIFLPLTLAILPVLMMKQGEQTFAMPLNAVREIVTIDPGRVQSVAGNPNLVVRGDVLPILELSDLIGRPRTGEPLVGVVATAGERGYVLAVDSFVGQDEVMIKPLEGIKPKGVAGATLSGEGVLVLVLDMHELLDGRV